MARDIRHTPGYRAKAAKAEEKPRRAASEERVRMATILGSPEAKNRQALALKLATDTDLPAIAAIDLLQAAPKGRASESGGLLKDMERRFPKS